MTREEFRITLRDQLARSDLRGLELFPEYLTSLVDIVETIVEPLFEEIKQGDEAIAYWQKLYEDVCEKLRIEKDNRLGSDEEINRLRMEIAKYEHKLELYKINSRHWEDQAIRLYFGKDHIGEEIFRNTLKTREDRIKELEDEITKLKEKQL